MDIKVKDVAPATQSTPVKTQENQMTVLSLL